MHPLLLQSLHLCSRRNSGRFPEHCSPSHSAELARSMPCNTCRDAAASEPQSNCCAPHKARMQFSSHHPATAGRRRRSRVRSTGGTALGRGAGARPVSVLPHVTSSLGSSVTGRPLSCGPLDSSLGKLGRPPPAALAVSAGLPCRWLAVMAAAAASSAAASRWRSDSSSASKRCWSAEAAASCRWVHRKSRLIGIPLPAIMVHRGHGLLRSAALC